MTGTEHYSEISNFDQIISVDIFSLLIRFQKKECALFKTWLWTFVSATKDQHKYVRESCTRVQNANQSSLYLIKCIQAKSLAAPVLTTADKNK